VSDSATGDRYHDGDRADERAGRACDPCAATFSGVRRRVPPLSSTARRARSYAWSGLLGVATSVASLGLASFGLASFGLGERSAHAQDMGPLDCDPPALLGPVEFFPASGAGGVALDAAVRVRYTPGFFAVWRDPLTRLLEIRDASDAAVPGSLSVLGDTLVFRPDAPWAPGAAYRGTAFGIDILQVRFSFRTGAVFDREPPRFDGTPTLSPARVDTRPCAPEGGYRIDVSVAPASDPDGAQGDVEYLLFQTRGPTIEAPLLRARARNFAGPSIPLAFTLTPAEAAAPICVVIVAIDGVGHAVEGSPACVDPVQGNYFAPLCSVGLPGASTRGTIRGAVATMAVLGLVYARRRRKERGQRRGPAPRLA